MAYFAVTYTYDPELADLADEIRPTHRAFLSELRDKGANAASGPLGGETPGALLIIEAQTAEEVEALLDEDPFAKAKVVAERVVRPWNPVISRF